MDTEEIEIARLIDRLFNELIEDVQASASLWASDPCAFTRRTYIRTVFAFVEGMIQVMKSSCLLFNERMEEKVLTPEEIVLLREEQAQLKENGAVSIRNTKISLAPNFRFAMACANKVFELNHAPDTGGQGWQDFKNAISIRNRITHPGSPEDLEIDEADIETVNNAMGYFRNETIPFIESRKI